MFVFIIFVIGFWSAADVVVQGLRAGLLGGESEPRNGPMSPGHRAKEGTSMAYTLHKDGIQPR
jgi:hypothetical protein